MWTAEEFDNWCKKEIILLKEHGFNSSTSGITRILYNKFIIPNHINISDLIKDEIKVKRK